MKKKTVYIVTLITIIIASFGAFWCFTSKDREKIVQNEPLKHVVGIVLKSEDGNITIADDEENLYIFDEKEISEKVGTEVKIDYKENKGSSNKSEQSNSKNDSSFIDKTEITNNTVVEYEVIKESEIPTSWLDGGIFKDYYVKAFDSMKGMSLDEKIGQTLLARYPVENQVADMQKYHLGGYLFFEVDFKGKSRNSVVGMIKNVQSNSKIPLLTAVDEEGGRVSRLSSNSNLTSTPFLSPQDLYSKGGWTTIAEDVKSKSSVLKGLGLNLNLAPVVDVSTNPSDYMYSRTIGLSTSETSRYASTVIEASKGTGVSYTLKHFPGYGNNTDTHVAGSIDNKSKDRILAEDIPPFRAGIESGAEAVMVAHNIVSSIDSENEASLSRPIHNLLRGDLGFTGVIIADDISMGALKNVENAASKAIETGNDIIITTDYAKSFNQIKTSIQNGSIKEDTIDRVVFRILAWKYYKGLL